MSMGQNYEPVLIYGKDWVKSLLTKHQTWPAGSRFFYASMCTYLLSAIVTRITGVTVAQYLDEKLFSKLGISNFYWEEDGMGRNTGGWGLHISTEDMARFGQFLLDNGTVDGASLLSENWIQMATSFQIETAPDYPLSKTENRNGYGYQFWLCSHDAYRASGLYGQLCMVQPVNGLVLSVTSAAGINLTSFIMALMSQVNSKKLIFMDNEFLLDFVMLEFFEDTYNKLFLKLSLSRRGKVYELRAARHSWQPFQSNFYKFSPFDRLNYATDQVPGYKSGTSFASFAWLDECTLEIMMRYTD
jgi:CubicO group peptidase (beta-lactamase class C family)